MKRSSSDLQWFEKIAKRELGNEKANLLQNLEWIDADILDVVSLEDAVKGCSRVYHTAAIVSFKKADGDWVMKTNVEGTANVVNVCLGVNPKPELCHFSSTAAIGRKAGNGAEINEDDDYVDEDVSDYSRSKYRAELEVYRGREEGLRAAVINPCIILGYGNWNSGPSGFFKNAWKEFPFYTTGSNAFVDVRDLVKASVGMMENQIFSGRYLCIGSNKAYLALFDSISSEFKKKKPGIKVSSFMAEIAWRLAGIYNALGGNALITKASARSGLESRSFSAERLVDELKFEFMSFEETIRNHSQSYLLDPDFVKM